MKAAMMVLSGALVLGGCTSTKTVYPTECKVESKIPVQKPEPFALEPSKKPYKFTDKELKGVDNTTVIKLISKNNAELWQEDRNKLRYTQQYIISLQEKGIVPK